MELVLELPEDNLTMNNINRKKKSKIKGSEKRLRLSVFRSNKGIYAQIINDNLGKTLISASSRDVVGKQKDSSKADQAGLVGELLAKKALLKGIKMVVFDRGCYRYHGRVKALAEGSRKGGLKF